MSRRRLNPARRAAARRERAADRGEATLVRIEADAHGGSRDRAATPPGDLRVSGPGPGRLTKRLFLTLGCLLIIVPFALLGYGGVLTGDLQGLVREDPTFAVGFLIAMLQPLVAWILRFCYRHLARGDEGHAMGNLIVLVCAEICMRNMVGAAGCMLLLVRVRTTTGTTLLLWARGRGALGVLADVSGSLVVLALGALCGFAAWRVGLSR